MPYEYAGVTEQRKAALKRRNDAKKLVDQGTAHLRGAMYLAGYSIECKVKAIAMEVHRCRTLEGLRGRLGLSEDEVYSHGLEGLIRRLLPKGTMDRLTAGPARDAFVGQVNQWRPGWRYDGENASPKRARDFFDALDVVWHWLERNA